ncbi:hypothetical protein N8530_00460, partial [bacterium]|nr:hypothetical protein [bacterium]
RNVIDVEISSMGGSALELTRRGQHTKCSGCDEDWLNESHDRVGTMWNKKTSLSMDKEELT